MMYLGLFVVPINAAQIPYFSDVIPFDDEGVPIKTIADDISDFDRSVFERFSANLEQYGRRLNILGMSAAVDRE
ncbi:MAG: hypothetical protein ACYS80_15710 [Planctomycetota bacterium]